MICFHNIRTVEQFGEFPDQGRENLPSDFFDCFESSLPADSQVFLPDIGIIGRDFRGSAVFITENQIVNNIKPREFINTDKSSREFTDEAADFFGSDIFTESPEKAGEFL